MQSNKETMGLQYNMKKEWSVLRDQFKLSLIMKIWGQFEINITKPNE